MKNVLLGCYLAKRSPKISFNLIGKNICTDEECTGSLNIYLDSVYADIVLDIPRFNSPTIPLADSRLSKGLLLILFKQIKEGNTDHIYLNMLNRDREDFHFVKK